MILHTRRVGNDDRMILPTNLLKMTKFFAVFRFWLSTTGKQ